MDYSTVGANIGTSGADALLLGGASLVEIGANAPASAGVAPRGSAAGSVGLSPSHISPRRVLEPLAHAKERSLKVAIPQGGGLFELKGYSDGPVGGGVRGRVSGYSYAARRRLLRLLQSLNRDALLCLPLFLTLTYPGEFSLDPVTWKRDLDAFCKRLMRMFPGASVVWKLEPQRRGAPHFHLLVFGVQFIDRVWLARVWYEVVGSGDAGHLAAGTQVQRVRSWDGVMAYASKYLAKVKYEFHTPFVGRWWGVVGRANLPIDVYVEKVRERAWLGMRRLMRRYLSKQGYDVRPRARSGLSVFLSADVGFRVLDYYLAPSS